MAVIILILIGAIGFSIPHYLRNKQTNYIEVSGNVEATEYNIGFVTPGRIAELSVDEGQKVERDAKLGALDAAGIQVLLREQKAMQYEAMARLEDIKAGSRPEEIEQASANVDAIDAELDKARKDMERYEPLARDGTISRSQFDGIKSAYDSAVARRKSAYERLKLVRIGPRAQEVAAAQYRVEQAREALAATEERLKNAIINSPVSGTILRKFVELGETVSAGVPVYTIGDLDHIWIKVYISEDKLGLIKLGQTAEVRVDSFPAKIFPGTITYISSKAEFTPKTVQTKEERVKLVFGVKVSVQNPSAELKPGMPADVRFRLE